MTLYDDLEIDNKADAIAIKRAYRKKAGKSHPDKGGSKEEFVKVQKAYLILSNPETRSKYDATGDEDLLKADNSKQEILGIVVTSFEVVIQAIEGKGANPLEFDIAGEMRSTIKEKKDEIEAEKKRLGKNISEVEKFLGRFKVKGQTNFMEAMLKSRIDGIKLNISYKQRDIDKFDEALELIEDMSFKVDPKEEQEYTNHYQMMQMLQYGV
jgi:DnaJ-class molecular chaperone